MSRLAVLARQDAAGRVGGRVARMDADALEQGNVEQQGQPLAELMAQGKSVRLEGLGTFRYTLSTKGVTDEADFDFQKQVQAVRVQFVPQREGAATRGSTATRGLVPTGIEWLAYDPSLETAGGGGGTEPGGSDGGGGEDPLS